MIRTYTEIVTLATFEERFEYLKMTAPVGFDTFGHDRYLNQMLYNLNRWKQETRNAVILRDNGCDLGISDRSILGRIFVHHMNPITKEDILNGNPDVFNPEYLICVSLGTHNALHYSNVELIKNDPIERSMNDTCPWKH